MRLFSIGPRIQKQGARLVVTTALRLRILSLGAFCRQVVVEPRKGWLMIHDRQFWFVERTRLIPFEQVEVVIYGFEDWTFGGWFFRARNTQELFRVGLRLRSGRELDLFRFYGEGPFVNESYLPDWWFWDEFATDATGTQEQESRLLVELLSKMIGVRVDRPRWG
ncbi:MAG: hypothetical protein RMK51_01790 [Meiothermus sp.]|nr:hypothetical protein [Meiothermus sp.]